MFCRTKHIKIKLIWKVKELKSIFTLLTSLNSCYYSWTCSQICFCFQKYANEANGSIQCQISLCTSASFPQKNRPLSPIFPGGGRWRMWHRLCQIDPLASFACQTADICNNSYCTLCPPQALKMMRAATLHTMLQNWNRFNFLASATTGNPSALYE